MFEACPVSVAGGVVLLARDLLPDWDGWPPASELLEMVGATKSQAYAMRDRLREMLPTVQGRPGRPSLPGAAPEALFEVAMAVLGYLHDHPGASCGGGRRRTYSDDFRRFVVGLGDPGGPAAGLSQAEFARVSGVPLGTIKPWLSAPPLPDPEPSPSPPAEPTGESTPEAPAPAGAAEEPAESDPATPDEGEDADAIADGVGSLTVRDVPMQTVLTLWPSWEGSFSKFCRMLRIQHAIPFSRAFIGDLLHAVGLRHRQPRKRSEAPWSSKSWRTFFPGAQWLGDGTSIAMHWEDQVFVFNVEAVLDAGSDAVVGFHVSDCEDEEAVCQAYLAGLETTGEAPLGFTLDNRPSNHTPGIESLLGDTILLRSTPGRGEAKAPLEGHYGLFSQSMPPLVLTGQTPREMARSALMLIFCAWSRGRNGRPRRRLNGQTPAEAYARRKPTREEVEQVLAWFHELQQRQERARATREARRDPVRLRLLDEGLAELGIPDPDRSLAVALAIYSRDAIAYGLATFASKQKKGTVPRHADPGRYLGGIIRNRDTWLELLELSDQLLAQRIRLHDFALEPLQHTAERLRGEHPSTELPRAFLDQALMTDFDIDFRFWTRQTEEAFSALPPTTRRAFYQPLCRRIAASFKTDGTRRAHLIDRLAQMVADTAA